MAATEPAKIRNIAVAGHRGVGKTSLVEALLFQAGKTNRLGTIEQGTTASDWEEHEQKRGMSLSGSLCHLEWNDRKINLVDTPGDAGFQADTYAALRVVEGVVVVLSGVMGVEVNTSRVWNRAEEYELSRVVFINMLDRERADFYPRARGRARAALRPLRRDPASDRRRARADGRRRSPPHVRVHGSVRRARGRSAADPRGRWPAWCRSTARSSSTPSSRPTRSSWRATSRARSSTPRRSRTR